MTMSNARHLLSCIPACARRGDDWRRHLAEELGNEFEGLVQEIELRDQKLAIHQRSIDQEGMGNGRMQETINALSRNIDAMRRKGEDQALRIKELERENRLLCLRNEIAERTKEYEAIVESKP